MRASLRKLNWKMDRSLNITDEIKATCKIWRLAQSFNRSQGFYFLFVVVSSKTATFKKWKQRNTSLPNPLALM